MDPITYQRRVSQRVADAIKDHDETVFGVAEATGIARPTLRRRLTGTSAFTVAELAAVAQFLELDMADLLAIDGRVA